MISFGDHDPEDAWTITDPVHIQLGNLADRAQWILERLRARVDAITEADHTQRLVDDLETVRARVRALDLD